MALEGIPEKVIMSIMGHKTRAMFDRYNIVTEADQRAFAKRLFGMEHGQSGLMRNQVIDLGAVMDIRHTPWEGIR